MQDVSSKLVASQSFRNDFAQIGKRKPHCSLRVLPRRRLDRLLQHRLDVQRLLFRRRFVAWVSIGSFWSWKRMAAFWRLPSNKQALAPSITARSSLSDKRRLIFHRGWCTWGKRGPNSRAQAVSPRTPLARFNAEKQNLLTDQASTLHCSM